MKIVFFSDVHGNHYAFHAFQHEMKQLQPDKIIFLGDIFGYYYGQEEILKELRKSEYICLLGNHDQMFLDLCEGRMDLSRLCERYGSSYRRNLGAISEENMRFLKSLSPLYAVQEQGIRIGAFHGSPDQPLNGRVYPDTPITNTTNYENYDYIFLGHTHHKMIRKINQTFIVNPGSIGQQRDGRGCSYVIFDTDSHAVSTRCISYPVSLLIDEIKRKDDDKPQLIEVLQRRPKTEIG